MSLQADQVAQLRLEQVSFAPQFRSAKRNDRDLAIAPTYLLQNVSFEAFSGDRIALIGASGAGKTTLLRLLNRLSEPSSGTLYLNGQPYPQVPVLQLRQQIVLVLQESKLLGMTVQQALAYPLQLRGVSKREIQPQVNQWIERLRIPTDWLHRTEQQLSVGQRQLVAIARALVAQPQILLLDEPTSALDAGRAHQVLDILIELSDRQQTTIVMANHQLDLAQTFSSRVLHLQQGQLIQDQATTKTDWIALKNQLQMIEMAQAQEWNEA